MGIYLESIIHMAWDMTTRYRLLLEINTAIVKYTTRTDLFNQLALKIKKMVPYDRFSINLYDEKENLLSYFSTAEGVSPKAISGDMRPLEKGAIAHAAISSRKPVIIPDLAKRTDWASAKAMLKAGLKTSLAFPLITHNQVLGVLHFSFKKCPSQLKEITSVLIELTDVIAVAVENMLSYTRLKKNNQNLLQQKNYLLENTDEAYDADAFYFVSPAMQSVMRQVNLIAQSDTGVLITGETGTGKDFVARHIHRHSARRTALFVKVNCPALSPGLFESELFGHSKGAFTGAIARRSGRFEMAHQGTIFLDEIGELPQELQAKMLHVLQDQYFERVGEAHSIESDVRVIAATNINMEEAIQSKSFRSDLFYRLNTVTLNLPPLRQRIEDIPGLVSLLNRLESEKAHRPAPTYTPSAIKHLCAHPWPGNVRELKNLIIRMIIMRPGESIIGRDIQNFVETGQPEMPQQNLTLAEVERQHIEEILARTRGKISGVMGAAALLGVPRTTLQYRLTKHQINASAFR